MFSKNKSRKNKKGGYANKLQHNVTIKHKRLLKKPKIIVGKLYAKWCGYCVRLQPEWKKTILNYKKNKDIKFVSIEDTHMQKKLQKFYNVYNIQESEKVKKFIGFPTIFKITNGEITYFSGNRISDELIKWIDSTKEN